MIDSIFTGVCTALVTPFLNGKVNYPMMEQLIRRQIEAGIEAIVLCGTTGESPTLSDAEKIEIIRRGKAYAGNRCKIIAGTGSNCTEHAVALSKAAEEVGADALLVVTPYYNKANNSGLIAHYMAIAHSVSIPIILYNVPSRTGVDIPVTVYQRLSGIPNIAGVKEASNDVSKIAKIKAQCPDHFSVWSGNDDLTLPVMAYGGEGVISVLSNVLPAEMKMLTDAAVQGDYKSAANLQKKLMSMMEIMFCDVNPMPVKAAMKAIGYDCGNCRLPLTELSQNHLNQIAQKFS